MSENELQHFAEDQCWTSLRAVQPTRADSLNAVALDTRSFRFNREEARER